MNASLILSVIVAFRCSYIDHKSTSKYRFNWC